MDSIGGFSATMHRQSGVATQIIQDFNHYWRTAN